MAAFSTSNNNNRISDYISSDRMYGFHWKIQHFLSAWHIQFYIKHFDIVKQLWEHQYKEFLLKYFPQQQNLCFKCHLSTLKNPKIICYPFSSNNLMGKYFRRCHKTSQIFTFLRRVQLCIYAQIYGFSLFKNLICFIGPCGLYVKTILVEEQ